MLGLLFVDFKAVALGYLQWQELEEDSWIDSVQSFHDFSYLDHVSSSVSVSIFRRTLLGYYAEGMHANC